MTLGRLSAADNRSSFSSVAVSDNHKRKLEDFADCGVDFLQKMKKPEVDADHLTVSQQSWVSRSSVDNSGKNRLLYSAAECSSACESSNRCETTGLQIFVRMMSGGKTIVIHADQNDTLENLYQRIQCKTKIPIVDQRVIYEGKQLQEEQSLRNYSIKQDAVLHLVGRLRSTEHPVAWQTVDDIMYTISRMYRGENTQGRRFSINDKLSTFLAMIPPDDDDAIAKYAKSFLKSSVPAALVILYTSSLEANKSCAKGAIKLFMTSCEKLPINQRNNILPVVLEFCKLLRKICPDHNLYVFCRNSLGLMLDSFDISCRLRGGVLTFVQEIFPFFSEIADLLVKELCENSGPSSSDVNKFSSFCQCVMMSIGFLVPDSLPIALPVQTSTLKVELENIHRLFRLFLNTMESCMSKVESCLDKKVAGNSEALAGSCSQYLEILKIIHLIAKVCQGGKELCSGMLNSRKASFCALIVKFFKRGDDQQWLKEYMEATNFEARRHLAMMLFPDMKEDYDEIHEMLIDRSKLLAESFEYIARPSPETLHGGLFMEFKNEEATGPGVLREWFFLVCQEIFNPINTLFRRSADDFRRFSPNPTSKVDPMHPDYFVFVGRVIALALMNKVQVGVLFDRVFFLQLAGIEISLEDIKDTDQVMYNSCKQILEMDPEFFDSNAGLDLTFVLETDELGKLETVELCPDGKSIAVDSKNRIEYVNLLIKHRFVTPISEHVHQFSKGFTDILSDHVPSNSFFKTLHLEDLDLILRGGEKPISIDDWKAHTEYKGFIESDNQIEWFWKVMEKMTEEEKRTILFFWTSNKFIPVEGFRGLSSKLHIYRLFESENHLPMAHTCFYRLSLPIYSSIDQMEERIRIIAQDHVSSSFGTP